MGIAGGSFASKENENQKPALITRLEELPEDTAQEVGWYLQDTCLVADCSSVLLTVAYCGHLFQPLQRKGWAAD